MEEVERNGAGETASPDHMRPEPSEPQAWRTTSPDRSIVGTEISIVPEATRERRDKRNEDKHNETEQDRAGLDKAATAYSAFETPWQERLLDCLLKMKPAAFERLCQRILKDSGFIKVEITGEAGTAGSTASACFVSICCHFTSSSNASGGKDRSARQWSEIFAGRWLAEQTRGSS